MKRHGTKPRTNNEEPRTRNKELPFLSAISASFSGQNQELRTKNEELSKLWKSTSKL
jgi:hypothetical protein